MCESTARRDSARRKRSAAGRAVARRDGEHVEQSGGLFSHKLLTNAPALARCVHVVTVDTFAFHKSLTNAPALTSSPRGPLNVQPVLTRIRIMKKEKKSLRESLRHATTTCARDPCPTSTSAGTPLSSLMREWVYCAVRVVASRRRARACKQ